MRDPDLDAAYDIEASVPDLPAIQARYAAASAALTGLDSAALDLAYGPDPRHRLDILAPPDGARAAILYFHGGYWKGGAKEGRRFPGPAWNERGVAWVPVEYRLAPAATVDGIVDDARRAVAWFHARAAEYGCDPAAIHIAGNSAGGHLTAMLAAEGWQAERGLPADVIASAAPVSGLFDLAPLRRTFANDWLALDAAGAQRNSPVHRPPRAGMPVVVAWGGKEPAAFRGQSEAYAAACRQAGANVTALECAGADHFSIMADWADPASALFRALEGDIDGAASARIP
ncbi:MAG: alpha/beta hydrolase [Rhodospirillaceae bacterium]|nr:alpha/beta hydrolase [Rhodospirillaceae bacterium]